MREMKDSGIEWIGEIPAKWKLNKIASLYEERTTKVSDRDYAALSVTKQGIVPQLEHAAKTDNGDNRKLIKVNDFVINSRSDRRGSCGISKYDGSCSLINTVLKPRRNMCNAYYSFVFRSEPFADEFYRWGNGIVNDLWSTKWSSMKNIYIPFPTLDTQHRIADYLDSKCSKIDAIIEREQAVIERLKEYKLSVITEAVTKGLNPDVEMKDSGIDWIGKIPRDWTIRKLKFFTEQISKGTTPKDMSLTQDSNYTIRYLKSENIVENQLSATPHFFITDQVHEDLKRSKLSSRDILFVIAGASIGKVAIMDTALLPANTNQAVSFIRVKEEDNEYIRYLWYYLQSNILKLVVSTYAVQSAQPNMSMSNLGNISISLPESRKDMKFIVDYLDGKCVAIDMALIKKQAIIDKLTEYKKSLIYEVVTGKKEV